MEYGSIERELYVDASPEVVFEVVSRPEHLREWWPDDATLDDRAPGGTGELTFGNHGHRVGVRGAADGRRVGAAALVLLPVGV